MATVEARSPEPVAGARGGGVLLELASLDRLIASAAARDAVLALVEGRAGIGKSRLIGAARDRAAGAGFRVLSARGTELEREFPFGMVRQLFEPLRTEPDEWERVLGGSAAAARSVFDAPPAEREDELRDTGVHNFQRPVPRKRPLEVLPVCRAFLPARRTNRGVLEVLPNRNPRARAGCHGPFLAL
jgi:hypothetical protein